MTNPKLQAEIDYAEGSNENPYPYHSEDWWEYELHFVDCCAKEAKQIHNELRQGAP